MSGVGKGVATASIGKILEGKGFAVSALKIDPYVNVDAGTMNPLEHGEVFVTDDGTECDQDVGNYERFLNKDFSTLNYLTTGRVYQAVIARERNLGYKGKCVEVVPHIPLEVIDRIKKVGKKDKADFVLIEIGGTVGEYQNLLFLEAARMMRHTLLKQTLFILVSYLPVPAIIGEMKTKPTQSAVRALNATGIQPDIILARSEVQVDKPRKRKISIFCNVDEKDVISAPDVDFIYKIPLNFEKDHLGERILEKFGIKKKSRDMTGWKELVRAIPRMKKAVKIAIVGKYFETGDFVLSDVYLSVIEAIKHACWHNRVRPEITWLSSDRYIKNPQVARELKNFDGVIVPGGFGTRGIEGKMKASEICRVNNIPYLGLCFGMQLAVIEFARDVCGLKKADSAEFSPTNTIEPVIDVMPDQKALLEEKRYGGTMRLGAYPCRIQKGTIAFRAYGKTMISERHRHRYELNNKYRALLEKKGMVMSGINPGRDLVEIIELKNHAFFMGTQFHPEFKSRPLSPHPLFREFIKAALRQVVQTLKSPQTRRAQG